ncbi:hypothetical protein HDK64DRAFT_302358, partial [Phyllosticta capitalensis]
SLSPDAIRLRPRPRPRPRSPPSPSLLTPSRTSFSRPLFHFARPPARKPFLVTSAAILHAARLQRPTSTQGQSLCHYLPGLFSDVFAGSLSRSQSSPPRLCDRPLGAARQKLPTRHPAPRHS